MRFIPKKRLNLFALLGLTAICLLWLLGLTLPGESKGLALDKIEEKKARFLNDRASDLIGTRPLTAPGLVTLPGLTGRGQLVGLADSGLDQGDLKELHPDLQSVPGQMPKVVLLKSWAGRATPDDPLGHGTHMAATIAGTGAASDGQFKGLAPGASLYFQALLDGGTELHPPEDLKELFYPAYSAGVRVHINGWGGGDCRYAKSAGQIDAFVRAYPDFLPLLAAGNSGPKPQSLTGAANSKNALVIGASQSVRPALTPEAEDPTQVTSITSRGPTGDGRLKPDLVAPGSAVLSACSRLVESNFTANPQYTVLAGTSMATAVAGGATTLLREWFQVGEKVAEPSAALLKAALINGARLPAKGPSFTHGFGHLDLTGTVFALRDGAMLFADEKLGVENGNYREYTFHLTDPGQPFKATLAWTDPPPQSPGTAPTGQEPPRQTALVNNLDLWVQDPTGQTYWGNHALNPDGAPDEQNNVEQVFLPEAPAGEYCIRVHGQALQLRAEAGDYNRLAQDFALVYGQPVYQGIVEEVMAPDRVKLAGGPELTLPLDHLKTVKDGKVGLHTLNTVLPGADLYQTPATIALINRTWQAGGIQALNTGPGPLFMEIDAAGREGGFHLDPRATPGIKLNDRTIHKLEEIPSGVEVSGALNPGAQTLWQVSIGYVEKHGFVERMDREKGQLQLLKDHQVYHLSSRTPVSVIDRLVDSSHADAPYGAGEAGSPEQILPGMQVRLVLSPLTQQVQFIAVQRELALGRIEQIDAANRQLQFESGGAYTVFAGAPVIRDQQPAELKALKTEDHVMAVLVPGAKEVIALTANSQVAFGRVMYLSEKQQMIYLIDQHNCFVQYRLTDGTRIYRRGLEIKPSSLTPGSWVRLILAPGKEQICRLDLAELALEESLRINGYHPETQQVLFAQGHAGQLNSGTLITKQGYVLGPEDLVAGDTARVYWLSSPAPWENSLAALEVTSPPSMEPPALTVLAQKQSQEIRLTGYTSAEALYLYDRAGKRERIPVGGEGEFVWYFKQAPEEKARQLVALDRQTGGLTGYKIDLETLNPYGFIDITEHWAAPQIATLVRRGTIAGYPDQTFRPEALITRAEYACLLARYVGWFEQGSSELTAAYPDFAAIPAWAQSAVKMVQAQGLMQSYPDGTFQPHAPVKRYELADAAARSLKGSVPVSLSWSTIPLYGTDLAKVPSWARSGVQSLIQAGVLQGRGTSPETEDWQLSAPATRAEAAALLVRILEMDAVANER